MKVAETATAQKGIKLQVDIVTAAARRGSAQIHTKRLQEESPGKDPIPLSAMAKTTETTTDQTARTETDKTGEGQELLPESNIFVIFSIL